MAWKYHKKLHIMVVVFLLFAVAHAIDVWDRRSLWTKNIESAQYSQDLFGVSLESGAQVFWEKELLASWLILNRPSFVNSQQAAGISFNRGTAVEVVRRQKMFDVISMQSQICALLNSLNKNNECSVDEVQVDVLCTHGDGPDYLVLTSQLQVAPRGVWSILGGVDGKRSIDYYLYRCADFDKNSNSS